MNLISTNIELPNHPRELIGAKFPEFAPVLDDWKQNESRLQGASVCLFTATNDGRPTVAGTGFILEVDGRHFLITAAHVIHEPLTEGRALYLPDHAGIRPGQELVNAMAGTPGTDKDMADFGFFELTNEQLKLLLANNIRPVPFEETDPSINVGEKGYGMICGFPEHKSKTRVSLKMIYATGTQRSGECTTDPSLLAHFGIAHSKWNFVIPSRRVIDIDTGMKIKEPSYAGYSGSPVWSVPSTIQWLEGLRPQLIGIVTTRSPKVPHPILITKTCAILGSLRDYYGIQYGRTRTKFRFAN